MTLIVKGKLANTFFLLCVREEILQTFFPELDLGSVSDICGFKDGTYPIRQLSVPADCYGNSKSVKVCVCQKLKRHGKPCTHKHTPVSVATHAHACIQTKHKHLLLIYMSELSLKS